MSVGAVNKSTGDRIPTAGMPAIDNALDLTSVNPVQNAVITAALAGKQATLTFDDVPTDNSNNPVKSSGVKSAIDAAVASAYHHAGTKTCAELVAGLLVAANEGNVYNITDNGTTTADFIDGAGQPIKAGDNVGIAKISDGVYKFDLLSGFVDTTNFVQKSQTVGLIKNDGTIDTVEKQPVTDNNLETTAKTIVGAINEHEGDIDSLKSGLTNLDTEVNGDATTYPYADVITIEDAVPANVADCSVKVEPVQDLHGYDKPWVGGAGKNQAYDVTYTSATNRYQGVVAASYKLKQGKRYIISFVTPNSGLKIYRQTPENIGFTSLTGYDFICDGTRQSMYGTASADATFTNTVILSRFSDTSDVGVGLCSNLQIEEVADDVTTPTDYAPYTNLCPISGHTDSVVTVVDDAESPTVTKTYTIALGDTIYGGTVDFDSGVMTVDRASVEYDGSNDENWAASEGAMYITNNDALFSDGTKTVISNMYVAANDGTSWVISAGRIKVSKSGANSIILLKDATAQDLTSFKALIAGSPLQVVYELATPITIQLTPTQIQLLKGQNTLYASTGQISISVNGVSGAIGSLTEEVNDHEERIEAVESGLTNLDTEVNGDAVTYPYADVITIENAVPANLADCSVKVEPVQDLHGQSAPWVGGAGKNKLPLVLSTIKSSNTDGTWTGNAYTINGGTITVNTRDDDTITGIDVSGTFTATTYLSLNNFTFANGTNYVLNGAPNGSSFGTYFLSATIGADYGSGVNISGDGSSNNVRIVIQSGTISTPVTFLPMVRLATESDATFAPYSNLCPISGHTEASVQRDGKNLISVNSYSGSGTWLFSRIFRVTGNYLYRRANFSTAGGAFTFNVVGIKNGVETSIDSSAYSANMSGYNDVSAYDYVRVGGYSNNASNVLSDVMLCFNDNNTDIIAYEPYAGKTYNIQLGDTIYGGTVDFDSGVMTVDRVKFTLTSATAIGKNTAEWPTNQFNVYPSESAKANGYIISDRYKTITAGGSDVGVFVASNGRIRVNTATSYQSASDAFAGEFASSEFCYELATPTTIQLTPKQIQLLKGTNTLYASTGDISVTVNGVSDSIGQVQEQVNELAEDVAEKQDKNVYMSDWVKTFTVKCGINTIVMLGGAAQHSYLYIYNNYTNVLTPITTDTENLTATLNADGTTTFNWEHNMHMSVIILNL